MNKIDLTHDVPLLLAILVLLLVVFMITRNRKSLEVDFLTFICYGCLIAAIVLMLFSCSPGRCRPSPGSRDYAVRSWWGKQRSDGYWVHYRQEGFKEQTAYAFACKLTEEELNRFYDSLASVK